MIIGLSMIGLVSCNNSNRVLQTEETENWDVFHPIETENIKIVNFIKSKNTPTGISIVTLPDGKRFIYCENRNNIAICQIIENGETSPSTFTTPIDTTTLY